MTAQKLYALTFSDSKSKALAFPTEWIWMMPNPSTPYRIKGIALLSGGTNKGVIELFNQAIKLNKNDATSLNNPAWL